MRRLDGCSTGEAKIIRFPLDRTTAIAIATVASALGTETSVEAVTFCCFGHDAADQIPHRLSKFRLYLAVRASRWNRRLQMRRPVPGH